MCLVVDKGIIASVLEKEDGKMPYFMAVDVTNWQEEGDGCEGHFKVVIDYILSNLYPCLGMEMLPKELGGATPVCTSLQYARPHPPQASCDPQTSLINISTNCASN